MADLRRVMDVGIVIELNILMDWPERQETKAGRPAMDDPKVVILIFSSGNLVCTGAKKEEEVHHAVTKLQETLEKKGLIGYE